VIALLVNFVSDGAYFYFVRQENSRGPRKQVPRSEHDLAEAGLSENHSFELTPPAAAHSRAVAAAHRVEVLSALRTLRPHLLPTLLGISLVVQQPPLL
jgi:hypothetical protein